MESNDLVLLTLKENSVSGKTVALNAPKSYISV
jgi:hypothetical protein